MGVAAANSQTIREEVAELLGISPDDVDPDVDLISQGLDSIRMMSLAGRWRRQGIDIDFASLAADPSVSAWSGLGLVGHRRGTPRQKLVATQTDSQRRSRSPRCSTRCGWAGKAISNSAVWQATSTSSSTATASIVQRLRAGGDRVGRAPRDAAGGVPARRHPADRSRARPIPSRRRQDLSDLTADEVEQRLAATPQREIAPAARRSGLRAHTVAAAPR